jgi:L-malate glycosyltransferase
MNILYITNHLNIGGITSYVLTLAKGMIDRGHRVYIASSAKCLPANFPREAVLLPIPIRTKRDLSPKILLSSLKLKDALKKYEIEIIHSNSRTTQILGCLLGRDTSAAHIFTCHGYFKRRMLRRLFPCWGSKVIAISEQVREHLVSDFKLGEEKISLIHNGIDTQRFNVSDAAAKSKAKERLGLGQNEVIGIIARLSDVKGHAYLIKAMPAILKEVPQARLFIVGEGRMRAELIALAKVLNLENSVLFAPELCDTMEVLKAMDIFVMPSLKEGLGLALMEAMACGLAVVGSNIGGIKSLIKPEVNGLLVEPGDVTGLAAAANRLLKDKVMAASFGRQARAFIADNFSQGLMVEQTENLYSKCLNR